MSYYHLPTSTERNPRPGERTATGAWLTPVNGTWTDELAAACGFVPITEIAAPTVAADQVAESSVAVVNGTPTRTWTVRAKTADEQAADTRTTNTATIEDRMRAAVAANATFLALATPTAAQNAAQVKALTRQINAIIRRTLSGDLLADTSGT